MKHLLLLSFLFVTALLSAQIEMTKSSISTGGGSSENGSLEMLFAIGEIAVKELDNSNIHLSEGFISPGLLKALKIENYQQLQGVSLYPNPVETDLYIHFDKPATYEISLFDITGKKLWDKNIENTDYTNFQMNNLSRAVYFLIIIDRQNLLYKQVKISKE